MWLYRTVLLLCLVPGNISNVPYGSNEFGTWIEDPHKLPAFNLTNLEARREIDKPAHQLGNDRYIALVYTSGKYAFRQDEGAPKLLNSHNPALYQYSAGRGFLGNTHTGDVIPTVQPESQPPHSDDMYQLALGCGNIERTVSSAKLQTTIKTTTVSPFGDDPVLFSRVAVNAPSGSPLEYVETAAGLNTDLVNNYIIKQDNQIQQHTKHSLSLFQTTVGDFSVSGLIDQQTLPYVAPKSTLYSAYNPTTYMLVITPKSSVTHFCGYTTEGNTLFGGKANVRQPNIFPLNNSTQSTNASTVLAAGSCWVQPETGEAVNVYIMYGYIPPASGVELIHQLLWKYLQGDNWFDTMWVTSSKAWSAWGVRFQGPEELSWVNRELIWNSYYTRSALTFDSFWGYPVLNQNGVYQWHDGFQGAARDPLSHILPFIWTKDWDLLKSMILYTLREVDPDTGRIPWGLSGYGRGYAWSRTPLNHTDCFFPYCMYPSDLEVWVMQTVGNYIMYTRDVHLLDIEITLNLTRTLRSKPVTAKVGDVIWMCFNSLRYRTGLGKHGLIRLLKADHNDGLLYNLAISGKDALIAEEHGESVMNTAMAIYGLKVYVNALLLAGVKQNATVLDNWRKGLIEPVKATLTTKNRWYKRVYLGNDQMGWRGDDIDNTLWMEPNAWAILAGIASEQNVTDVLVHSIDVKCRQRSKVGSIYVDKIYPKAKNHIYSGSWYCSNMPLIQGLGQFNYNNMSMEEWLKNTFAVHAASFPHIWEGTFSGPDAYDSIVSNPKNVGGRNVPYKLHNTWAHSMLLWTLPLVWGFEAVYPNIIKLSYQLELWPTYQLKTQLVGIGSKNGTELNGYYRPLQCNKMSVMAKLPATWWSKVESVKVNGMSVTFQQSPLSKHGFALSFDASCQNNEFDWLVHKTV